MSFWTEIHWSEGMFLRPHHLQAGQRWLEGLVRTGLDSVRPFAWAFVDLQKWITKNKLELKTRAREENGNGYTERYEQRNAYRL